MTFNVKLRKKQRQIFQSSFVTEGKNCLYMSEQSAQIFCRYPIVEMVLKHNHPLNAPFTVFI
jgi:hypothetical protein